MAKDPAFLFYSSDFLSGTLIFSNRQKGQYITLLAVMHQSGRLSIKEMEIVLREPVDKYVLAKFKKDETGKYFNDRLEIETDKRKKFTESRRKSLDISNGDLVYLYLLLDQSTGNYKIGSSKYPHLRLSELQKKNPQIISYWVSEKLLERIKERELHIKYKSKKVRYDWFSLSTEDLENIMQPSRTESENENENRNVNAIKNEIRVEGTGGRDLVFNAETEVLSNPIEFERICMNCKKSKAEAGELLRDYHLYLTEKELYPKTRKAVFAGFEKWIRNEKKFYGNKQTNGAGTRDEKRSAIQTELDDRLAKRG